MFSRHTWQSSGVTPGSEFRNIYIYIEAASSPGFSFNYEDYHWRRKWMGNQVEAGPCATMTGVPQVWWKGQNQGYDGLDLRMMILTSWRVSHTFSKNVCLFFLGGDQDLSKNVLTTLNIYRVPWQSFHRIGLQFGAEALDAPIVCVNLVENIWGTKLQELLQEPKSAAKVPFMALQPRYRMAQGVFFSADEASQVLIINSMAS